MNYKYLLSTYKNIYTLFIVIYKYRCYTLSLINTLNILNHNKLNHIFNIVFFKKKNSILKKKSFYFNFFNDIKLATLYSTKKTNNQRIFNKFLVKKKATLFTKRPFDRKKLKKKLISLRYYYRNYILSTESNRKLLRHINSFKNYSIKQLLIYYNYNLKIILKRLCWAQTTEDIKLLFKNSCIFINRDKIINFHIQLKKCDTLELFISNSILFYNKWISYNFKKKIMKYSYKYKLKENDYSKKLKKEKRINKFLLRYNRSWLETSLNNFEINYFCMTAILLYNSVNQVNTDNFIDKILSYYIIRLYNWGWYM